jgi:prevent-host-death family protein
MKRVGIAELKDNLSRLLRGVEAGEPIEVLDRARPIARIVPVEHAPAVQIHPAGRSFAAIRDRTYPPVAPGIDVLELLREERAERDLAAGQR